MNHTSNMYSMVTPTRAEAILTKNTMNRPLRSGVVEKYAADMKAGRWKKNGETVKITDDGTLIDGQHRLWAVIESGMTVPLIILEGVDPDVLATIDTGAPRSYADYRQLSAQGRGDHIKNVTVYQAVVRLAHWYENHWPGVKLSGKRGQSHQELDDIAQKYPNLAEHVNTVCASMGRIRHMVTATKLAFVYAMAAEQNPTRAQHWLATMVSGEGGRNNPAISVRERLAASRLSGHKLDPATEVCFLIKSWNAFARDETLAQYRWAADEAMPAILGTPQYEGKRGAAKVLAAKAVGKSKRLGKRGKSV